MPDIAAKLYALSLALDDPACRNPSSLILQGKLLVRAAQERRVATGPGRESAFYLDAAATFMRSWAKHDDYNASDILDGAALLELGREVAILASAEGPEAA
jgi:hypothetical protein